MEINLEIFNQETVRIFLAAIRFALHMGHRFLGSEHLLWALIQNSGKAGQILRKNGLDQTLVEEYLHQYDWDAKAEIKSFAVQLSEEAEQIVRLSENLAKSQGSLQIRRKIFFTEF